MKAVIFDMDGVLVDTESVYMQIFYDLFINNNFKVNKKDIYKIIGTSDETTWKLLGEMVEPSLSSEEVENLYYSQVDTNSTNFYDLKFPHVQKILTSLKNKNIKTGIASTSSIDDIENMMKQTSIENKIDFYISGDSVSESKPNPEIYLQAMKKLNVSNEETIIVEDSYSGIRAGKIAGAFVIAIKDRKFGIDQSNADLIVQDLLEAYKYILKEFKKEQN